MDGLGAPLSQFSGGSLVELIGFHVSRLQFQLLHPGGAKIGVSRTPISAKAAAATPNGECKVASKFLLQVAILILITHLEI